MAPISKTETFSVSISPEVVHERVMAWFEPLRPTVVADTPERLEVTTGVVDGSTQVTVTASDAIGFGAKTGIKKKYELRVAEVVAQLRAALASTAPASRR